MLFSASTSDSLNASSASPLDTSLLQANLAALSSSTASSGLIDPLQQSSLLLSSSAAVSEVLDSLSLNLGDNTQETARDIGRPQAFTTYSFTDYVGNSDAVDYYKFTLDRPCEAIITISGVNAEIGTNWYGGNFSQSGVSIPGQKDTHFFRRLNPSTYYIAVKAFSGNSDYTLRIQTNNNSYTGDKPSLLARQEELGALRGSQAIVGHNFESLEQYHFSLLNTSDLSFSLDNSRTSLDLVQDRNQNEIADSGEVLNIRASSLSLSGLPAGSYFARIHIVNSGSEKYNLVLNATPGVNLGLEPNDTLNQAIEIGSLAGQRAFSNSVGTTDKNDYYRFNLSEMSTLDLSLSGLAANADVQIIRDVNHNGVVDSGEVVASSTLKGTASELIQRQGLDVGAYFVRVNGIEGNTNYTLTLTGSPGAGVAPEPNDTLAAAYNIGTLNTLRKFDGSVGWSDANDYYRFTVGTTRQVDLILENLSALANIQLLDSNGAVIATGNSNKIFTSYGSRIDPAQISRALNPGDYILQVQHYEDPDYYPINPDTTYTLRLAA